LYIFVIALNKCFDIFILGIKIGGEDIINKKKTFFLKPEEIMTIDLKSEGEREREKIVLF